MTKRYAGNPAQEGIDAARREAVSPLKRLLTSPTNYQLSGRLDFESVQDVAEDFRNYGPFESVDLTALSFSGSSGVSFFIETLVTAAKAGPLTVVGASDDFRRLIGAFDADRVVRFAGVTS